MYTTVVNGYWYIAHLPLPLPGNVYSHRKPITAIHHHRMTQISFNGVSKKKSDFEGTLLSNVTNDVKNGSFNGVSEKKSDFEGTLLSNVTNDVKNSSFNGFMIQRVVLRVPF
ncbi:hypothetical protein CTI12_AA385540 [Artemisia annua]|uniref:Uncharacterized protein n=1 Tax=Artemisia annua TaxID=35608 RepID=A0A2U1MFL0_ARTAN|nr:hypothetical protein CTI12_AA385540 [Artemisia annua]